MRHKFLTIRQTYPRQYLIRLSALYLLDKDICQMGKLDLYKVI